MQTLPHLVLDGAQLAAQAVGADELVVCVCETAQASVEASTHAISERRGMPLDSARMHLTAVPGHYIAGQEAALVNHLNGGPAIPTFTPPMVFEQGVRRRPTLGGQRRDARPRRADRPSRPGVVSPAGYPFQPGSALVTLSGALAHPGVYEIEHGASLQSLIDAAGGMLANPRALLVGGYGGSWIGGEFLHGVALSDEHLAPHGASLGAGVVLLLSEDACPVAETARVARWMAGQSAGQCGPCVDGLGAIAASVAELAGGHAQGNTTRASSAWPRSFTVAALADIPTGQPGSSTSALDAFGPEFADHARHGPCEGAPVPESCRCPSTADRDPDPRTGVCR